MRSTLRDRFSLILLSSIAGGALGTAGPVSAETLQEALAAAYQNNPTISAARAGQRANDENVPIQKSLGRPQMLLEGSIGDRIYESPTTTTSRNHSLTGTATAQVPIFSGGAVRNGIKAARTRVEAGREDLRSTEMRVFTDVVATYVDVLRDSAVVALNEQNVKALDVNLQASSDRFEVGDLTRTDVAQSQSRLSLARGQLESARAQLIASRERYIALVGHEPLDLQSPPPLPALPDSPETAVSVALTSNPDLGAARKLRDAARYDVRIASAARLPRISAFAQGSYNDFLDSSRIAGFAQQSKAVTVGARLTLPLYQGGGPAARVRQSQAFESQAIEQATGVERDVVAQTRSYYASWKAAMDVIESSRVAVDATGLSLEGVRAENSVGTRTILDILNAEQEALQARVQLVTARRDAYVAGFTLLTLMGQVAPTTLGIDGGALYDPQVNYKRVKNKFIDWDDDPRPKPVSTSTAATSAQKATVPPNPRL